MGGINGSIVATMMPDAGFETAEASLKFIETGEDTVEIVVRHGACPAFAGHDNAMAFRYRVAGLFA